MAVTAVEDGQRAKAVHGILGSLAVYGNAMELVHFDQPDGRQDQDAGILTKQLDAAGSPIPESDVAAGTTDSTGSRTAAALTSTSDIDSMMEASTTKQDTSEAIGSVTETQNARLMESESSYYDCDGPCFQRILWSKTVYRCNFCLVNLCESCHDLVKEEQNTGFAVCSMTHEFFEFPPIEQYPPKKMKVGDDFVFIQDWLNELADEYGISRRRVVE